MATDGHRVTISMPVRSGAGRFHVIECACGWSTPLCRTARLAEEQFEQHRRMAWQMQPEAAVR